MYHWSRHWWFRYTGRARLVFRDGVVRYVATYEWTGRE